MSYSKGFKDGYQKGFNDAFAMVLDKIGTSVEFAGAIRKKQLKIIKVDLATQKQSHKQPKPTCNFCPPWSQPCGSTKILDNGQCENHQGKCSCGKVATHACSFAGQFICGRPLCDDCRCNH